LAKWYAHARWVWLGTLVLSCSVPQGAPFLASRHCETPPTPTAVQCASSGLLASFSIVSTTPNDIELALPVRFVDDSSAADWVSLAPTLASRAKQCLAEARPYLLGPQGETLSIRLVEPNSEQAFHTVKVTAAALRGHSHLWQAGWQCPEILHEVFHLLGLVDSYQEPGGRYSCRVLGPQDSIMSDPRLAYDTVLRRRHRESLLYPGEFNAVAYPGCQSKNQTYYACAQRAYREKALGCGNIPSECSAEGGDWVNH
jgi:hypothetical protein